MALKIYISGKYYAKEDAKINVFDHGLLYGDGVFEGIRVYNEKVFRLKEHIDRLWDSAKAIWLNIPMTRDEMMNAVCDTVKINGFRDCYIRLVVTRGIGSLGLDPTKCSMPEVIIIADSIALYPAQYYEKGLEIITASTTRIPPAALSPRIKSLNYLNNILAKIEGIQSGCGEVLMLNHKGEVSECTADNIFLVSKGSLLTPPVDAGILEGVTRGTVIELAREARFQVREVALTKFDVYIADEVFLTGSGAEIVPVVKIDNRIIGDGKPGHITKTLHTKFHEFVRR